MRFDRLLLDRWVLYEIVGLSELWIVCVVVVLVVFRFVSDWLLI